MFDSIDDLIARLGENHYFLDRDVATAIFLGSRLAKPVLLDGEPGTGKTDLARVLATAADTVQFTLQCYPGFDQASALSEWDPIQDHLVKRPLLAALTWEGERPPILLIDDVDRVDGEFAAFLVGVLRDLCVNVVGVGTVRAVRAPLAILTADLPGEVAPPLRQCCLFQRLSYPSFERERAIVVARVPGVGSSLAGQICNFVARMRQEAFKRKPGVGETLDWARALTVLHRSVLDADTIDQTLGCVLKDQEDIKRFRRRPLSPTPRPLLDRTG